MFALGRRRQCAIAVVLACCAPALPCPASAASGAAICASGAGPRAPAPVPKALEAEVAGTFDIPVEMVRDGAYVRCAGTRLLACAVGANLNCGKANRRRSLPGASEFCRSNPNADNIPMAATGHDTIYEWRCVGRRAVPGKVVVAVDPDGYDAGNWKEIHR